jgi:Holliday junction resolvase
LRAKKKRILQESENQKLNLRLIEDVKNLSELSKSVEKRSKTSYYRKKNKVKRISKNTAYKRGRQFEYRVKKHFEKLGYYVKRSYASKGAEDLIAIKSIDVQKFYSDDSVTYANISLNKKTPLSEVFLIQCKNLKVEKKLNKEEADRLKKLAKQCGATPLLAQNINHKLKIEEI